MSQVRHLQPVWELSLPDGAVQPSGDLLHLLVHGDPARAPEAVAQSCLLGVWNAVGDWELAERLVAGAPALRADLAKSSRGLGWLRRVRRNCERVATGAPNRDRAHEVRAELADAHRRAEVRQWPRLDGHRVSGASVTRVLRAVLVIAGDAGRVRGLHLAVRTVAEQAGVSRGTAQSALRYLQSAHVLVRLDGHQVRDGKGHAATYSLELDTYVLPDDSPEDDHQVQPAAAVLLSHDAWRWRGLGGAAGHVWVLLSDTDPLDVEQVAALRGRSVTWTTRLLRRLAEHGLAVRTGDTWTRCTLAVAQDRLDVAARHVGTAGKGEAVRAKHAQERADWERGRAAWLARSRAAWAQQQAAPTGAVCDPSTGTWVDLETGEVVPGPATDAVPPVPAPIGLTATELHAQYLEQRERDAQARAEMRGRSDALADRLHAALDAVEPAARTELRRRANALPNAVEPAVLDLSDLAAEQSAARSQVAAGALGMQQQAERIQQTLALVASSPRVQELADRMQATFAHLVDVGRPLQELADRMQDTLDAAVRSAEKGRD